MLTIASIAGGGSGYYLESGTAKSSYYLDGNSRTYWDGGALPALGFKDGEISRENFDQLMAGIVSDEKRIGNACKTHGWSFNPGRDFTFSDPKTVSILLQGDLRPEILEIKRDAIKTAMEFGEEHFAKARVKGEIVGNQKMVWAVIHEDTSRADDPNGHAHVINFNILQGEDGKFRAMHNTLFYDHQILLGQIYRTEIAKGIKDLKFEIEPAGEHGLWEIKDIPNDIRENFSKRRQAILKALTPENDTPKGREMTCLTTRPGKQNLMLGELKETWAAELETFGTSFSELSKPNSVTRQNPSWTIEERVKTTFNIIAETQSKVNQYKFFEKVMDRTDGHFTIKDIQQEVERQIENGVIVRPDNGEYFARSKDLRREKQLDAELSKGHNKSKPLLSESQILKAAEGTTLKSDQKMALRLLTRSHDRVIAIAGPPGTGKSYTNEIAVLAIKANGYKVVGLPTTSESTALLEETDVFDKVMTFQKYLIAPQGDEKTVLIVDEASMIGRDDMISLLHFVNRNKFARVVFQGDGNQMSGVKAGTPFANIEKSGVRTVFMDEIIRQKDERHREGIVQLGRKDIRGAFKTLKPEIYDVSLDKMTDYAIKAWRDSGNEKTPIIIQTNKQKAEINAQIKAEKLKANPSAKHLTLKTWQSVHKSDEEKKFVESYKGASHIRFNKTFKHLGIERGDIYKLDGINQERAELQISKNGTSHLFRPAMYKMGAGAIELYKQEERTLHEGDRIRFTRGGHRQPVNNNQYGTIKSINGDKVSFELDKKTSKELTLSLKDKSIRHIDHAWASTTHAYQGKTVDEAIVVMPSRGGPLTSLESLLTGASRHRFALTIITDNSQRLQQNIEKTYQLKKFEANLRWPEQEATTRSRLPKNPFKPPQSQQSIPSPQIQISSPRATPKETVEFAEPVVAKNIIKAIQIKRNEQKSEQETNDKIHDNDGQRSRGRGR